MRIDIYGEAPSEDVVRLRLIQDTNYVYLAAVDEYGEVVPRGYLMEITKKGFRLSDSVDPRIGLLLGPEGRVNLRR